MTDDRPDHPGAVPSTGQTRAAEALLLLHGQRLRYVFGTAAGWHYWDGMRWKPDGSNRARSALRGVVQHLSTLAMTGQVPASTVTQLLSSTGQRGALEIAAHLDGFAVEHSQMDTHPHLLNCTNGTLDLNTLHLRDHDPDDHLTQVTNAAYDPDAKNEIWDLFLATVLPDVEVRQYLQRLIGYALLGEVREHVFPILIGPGGNGKGTFYETVMHALGDYAAPFDAHLLIATRSDFASANAPAPALLGLKGKRFVVTSETEEDAKLATAKMKFYTGGDTITARAMYARTETVFEPSHTMFMVTNYEPQLSAEDEAAWQRITTVPFNVQIRGTDLEIPGFTHRLKAARDMVLTWAVEGLRQYYALGLAPPDQVLARRAQYRASIDHVARYLTTHLIADPAQRTTRPALWEDWTTWARAEGVEQGSRSNFYARVAKDFPEVKSNGVRYFDGVAVPSQVQVDQEDLEGEVFTNVTPIVSKSRK